MGHAAFEVQPLVSSLTSPIWLFQGLVFFLSVSIL